MRCLAGKGSKITTLTFAARIHLQRPGEVDEFGSTWPMNRYKRGVMSVGNCEGPLQVVKTPVLAYRVGTGSLTSAKQL